VSKNRLKYLKNKEKLEKIALKKIDVSVELKEILRSTNDEVVRNQYFQDYFTNHIGKAPDVVAKAGGRVNLIGEHVDYPDVQFTGVDGAKLYSMGSAIQNNFCCAISKRDDSNCVLIHLDAEEMFEISISELNDYENACKFERENKVPQVERCLPEWAPHTLGTIKNAFDQCHESKGVNILMTSNVPFGAGLSASAANCAALTICLNQLFELGLKNKIDIVTFARASENSIFAGGHCGWLDYQLIVQSQKDLLTQVCYADNSIEYFESKLASSMQFIAINTNVPHVLAESDYVVRVAELDFVIRFLSDFFGKDVSGPSIGLELINKLIQIFDKNIENPLLQHIEEKVLGYQGPVNKEMLNKAIVELQAVVAEKYNNLNYKNHESLSKNDSFVILLKRLRHQCISSVLVPLAGQAAKSGDTDAFGELLSQEGVSLRMSGDFEITGTNGAQDRLLDIGFEVARELDHKVFGRMLGGGGGGNVLFFADRSVEDQYIAWKERVCLRYDEWSSRTFEDKPIATTIEPLVSPGAKLCDLV